MHYYTHRGRHAHPTSFIGRLTSGIVLPVVLVLFAGLIATGAAYTTHTTALQAGSLVAALGASLLRLFIAYVLSMCIGVPLGLLAESNHRIESILLPVYDVLESIPILAFFPLLILFFVQAGSLEGAALFILVFSMVWSITFNTIGGLKVIPRDVVNAGKVFGLSWWQRLAQIQVPALFPPLVTGSILALANGWNMLIVAEALHAYAPQSSGAHDLYGIGSVLVTAGGSGDVSDLLSTMLILVLAIAAVNIFIWQPLLAHSENYKFE